MSEEDHCPPGFSEGELRVDLEVLKFAYAIERYERDSGGSKP